MDRKKCEELEPAPASKPKAKFKRTTTTTTDQSNDEQQQQNAQQGPTSRRTLLSTISDEYVEFSESMRRLKQGGSRSTLSATVPSLSSMSSTDPRNDQSLNMEPVTTRPTVASITTENQGLPESMRSLKRRQRQQQRELVDTSTSSRTATATTQSGTSNAQNNSNESHPTPDRVGALDNDSSAAIIGGLSVPWRRAKRITESSSLHSNRRRFSRRHRGGHDPLSSSSSLSSKNHKQSKVRWLTRSSNKFRPENDGVEADTTASQEGIDSMRTRRYEEEKEEDESVYGPGAYAIEGPHLDLEDAGDDFVEQEEAEEAVVDAQVQQFPKEEESHSRRSVRNALVISALVAAIAIIAAAVSVAIVITQSGDDTTRAPTTFTPTAAPTSDPWARCFGDTGNFRSLNIQLSQREDFGRFVDVTLCQGSFVSVGELLSFPLGGLLPPMNLQSNMRFRCGASGALAGRCVVSGLGNPADALVVNARETSGEVAAQNVTIEGISFEDAPANLVRLYNGGDIVFRNCAFRSRKSHIPILIDYQPLTETPTRQHVTFQGCIFEDLVYGEEADAENLDEIVTRQGGINTEPATVIHVSHPASTVTFTECIFRNIRVSLNSPGYLMSTQGAAVRFEKSCFYGIGSAGVRPILLVGEEAGIPSLVDVEKGNFIEGTWTCGSVNDGLGNATSCQEVLASSPACLADIAD